MAKLEPAKSLNDCNKAVAVRVDGALVVRFAKSCWGGWADPDIGAIAICLRKLRQGSNHGPADLCTSPEELATAFTLQLRQSSVFAHKSVVAVGARVKGGTRPVNRRVLSRG